MGNVPNKWIARGSALVAAAVAAAAASVLGREAGRKLAHGFTFDWYVHPVKAAIPYEDALLAASLAASLAAFFAIGLLGAGSALLTRWRMRALRHVPPRYGRADSLDVHLGLQAGALPLAMSLLAVLGGYLLLSWPVLAGGEAVTRLSPTGYVTLLALSAGMGAGLAGLVAALTTHHGLVSGRIVWKSDRNLIARVSLFGMRHAKTTVALVLGVSLLAGHYASTVTTNVDVADVLPRGDPNTAAAKNLTAKFTSSFTQQVTFQFRVLDPANASHVRLYEEENARKLPLRATEPDMGNITDELYIRAVAEVIDFAVSQHPFAGSSGVPDLYKLLNWTIAGGETESNREGDAAFSIPPTDREGELRYASVEQGVIRTGAVHAAVDALASPSWRQTAALVTADPDADVTTKEIGEAGLRIRDEWVKRVERGETTYKVFGPDNPPQFSVDLPIANAHASELTREDFTFLLPIIGVFIALTLFIAFRNVTSVVATFSMLATAVVWTFGAMGFLEIPLNTLNLAVVPLIMGVGIDYGIHMMNEYQEQRAHGKTAEEAWVHAGGGSALALFVGMLTTCAGLVVMVVSPSLLVAQLGLLAVVAMLSCYVLAVLFIPAVVTLMGGERRVKRVQYHPSVLMPAAAAGVSRARLAVLFLVLLLTGAAMASAATIHREAFGDPPRNWLEDDPLRQEHERAINGFYDTTVDDVKANVLIFEGDLTDPAAHAYIDAITRTLRENDARGTWTDPARPNETVESRIIGDTLKDLPFIVRTYLTVHEGIPGVARYLGAEAQGQRLRDALGGDDPTRSTQTYPQSRPEIRATLDGMFASPLHQFGNLFVDRHDYGTAVTIFSVRAATYEDAEAVWNEVQAAIAANEALRPADMKVSFFGNTAINYLFVAKQVPWLTYMSIATNVLVVLIVFAFTRDLRATALVGVLNFLTSTLWIGFLPHVGIGLAINLTLPLVFIYAIGSDYGLHLGMRCKRTGDTRAAMESVGKGVLFSFVTTFGAFLVFTQISDLAGRRAMVATAIAIGLVFLVTLLTVPLFYPVKKPKKGDKGQPGDSRNVPVVEKRAEDTSVVVRAKVPETSHD